MQFHADSTGLLSSSFGQGTGPIFLDNVACVGTENSLEDCTHDPSAADCTHHEDAAVRCSLNGKGQHLSLICTFIGDVTFIN